MSNSDSLSLRAEVPAFCWHPAQGHQTWEPVSQQQLPAQGNGVCVHVCFGVCESVCELPQKTYKEALC